MDKNTITTFQLFDGTQITKNTSQTSEAVDLRRCSNNGMFSVYCIFAGDGTAKVEYLLCATENGTYIEPSTASDIASGQLKTSGPGGDGVVLVAFEPELAPFMKITETANSGNNHLNPKLWLNVQ
jgi:hypothetical protein